MKPRHPNQISGVKFPPDLREIDALGGFNFANSSEIRVASVLLK
jgi:hypothetical protein